MSTKKTRLKKGVDALLLVDVLNDLEFVGGERVLPWAQRLVRPLLSVCLKARRAGIPVIYANDTIASGVLGRKFAERERMVPLPQAPLWKFLVVTGLRYGEAATLRWSDIDEDAGVVTVRAEVAKSKRTRHVPAPRYLVEDLRALRQIQAFTLGRVPEPGDRVFLSPKHRPLDPNGNPARLVLTRLLKRAGIPYQDENGRVNVDIHALRRNAGTRLARHSVPLSTVSAIMGHSDVRLSQRYYIDLRIADTKKAVEGVPEVGAAPRSKQTTAHGG